MVDFKIDLYGYVYIWWKMKITESRYGYSEVIDGFCIVILVSMPFEFITKALTEVNLPRYATNLRFPIFPALWVCVEIHVSIWKSYSPKTPIG